LANLALSLVVLTVVSMDSILAASMAAKTVRLRAGYTAAKTARSI